MRSSRNSDYEYYDRDLIHGVGMGQAAVVLAKDWTNDWRTGIKQNIFFQTYKLTADSTLDDRKGMSWGDLHYWDQLRIIQTKQFALGAMHESFFPWWGQYKRGLITHQSANVRIAKYDVHNLQSAGEFVQGFQLQSTWTLNKLPHDLNKAFHVNLGARYYWRSKDFLPIIVLGVQTHWNDEWVFWSTLNHTSTTSFEQGIRHRANKSRTIDFYIRQSPFQTYDKFTWKEKGGGPGQFSRYQARFQQEPKLLIGFKVAYSWSPHRMINQFSNHYDYLDPQLPFTSFGASYFIPSILVGDSVPMPRSRVYKGFEVNNDLGLTLESKQRVDSIVTEMLQHPVRMELRVAYGEAAFENTNQRIARLIGESIGDYMVANGISKRRLRVSGQATKGLEDWERVRLYTKVYSMPLEPPKQVIMPVNGLLRGVTFNRDGFITEEGQRVLRHLSMQIEKFDLQVEIHTRSNRSKDPAENLRLSQDNVKQIGYFLVNAGVSPESLRLHHLGDKDIPQTENESVMIYIATPEESD